LRSLRLKSCRAQFSEKYIGAAKRHETNAPKISLSLLSRARRERGWTNIAQQNAKESKTGKLVFSRVKSFWGLDACKELMSSAHTSTAHFYNLKNSGILLLGRVSVPIKAFLKIHLKGYQSGKFFLEIFFFKTEREWDCKILSVAKII
jgi:hypothetical protein